MKHTPGPWIIDCDGITVRARRPEDAGIMDHNLMAVAVADAPDDAEAEANARLIAAAPEQHVLLVELEAWLTKRLEWIDKHGQSSMFETNLQAKVDAIRAAIAKATGEDA